MQLSVQLPVRSPDERRKLGASLGAERFLREIEIEASLTHPNILPLYDSGEAASGRRELPGCAASSIRSPRRTMRT